MALRPISFDTTPRPNPIAQAFVGALGTLASELIRQPFEAKRQERQIAAQRQLNFEENSQRAFFAPQIERATAMARGRAAIELLPAQSEAELRDQVRHGQLIEYTADVAAQARQAGHPAPPLQYVAGKPFITSATRDAFAAGSQPATGIAAGIVTSIAEVINRYGGKINLPNISRVQPGETAPGAPVLTRPLTVRDIGEIEPVLGEGATLAGILTTNARMREQNKIQAGASLMASLLNTPGRDASGLGLNDKAFTQDEELAYSHFGAIQVALRMPMYAEQIDPGLKAAYERIRTGNISRLASLTEKDYQRELSHWTSVGLGSDDVRSLIPYAMTAFNLHLMNAIKPTSNGGFTTEPIDAFEGGNFTPEGLRHLQMDADLMEALIYSRHYDGMTAYRNALHNADVRPASALALGYMSHIFKFKGYPDYTDPRARNPIGAPELQGVQPAQDSDYRSGAATTSSAGPQGSAPRSAMEFPPEPMGAGRAAPYVESSTGFPKAFRDAYSRFTAPGAQQTYEHLLQDVDSIHATAETAYRHYLSLGVPADSLAPLRSRDSRDISVALDDLRRRERDAVSEAWLTAHTGAR